MKLATVKNGRRDGQLVVVSRDLSRAVAVPEIASTLQQLLDNWGELEQPLIQVYQQLNDNCLSNTLPFNQAECESPLPRAYHWADASAYVNHVELVRKARGAEMPESFWTDPLIYQGGSDCFVGPRDPIVAGSTGWGIDFESEIAVITDDVAMATPAEIAEKHIKLLMLVNDVSLRNLIPGELAKGFGFYQSKPASAFSPIALTPDELGNAWRDCKLHLPLITKLNGQPFGAPDAGSDMTFNFAQLISHATKTRALGAGTIIGSGTVSNYDRSAGSSCLAEKRMLETITSGKPLTPFLNYGDRVRIEMFDQQGNSLFGAIEQTVEPPTPTSQVEAIMDYTLYSYWRSSAAYRVRIALNLKGISYRTEAVHLTKHGGEQRTLHYRLLNPSALVPSLGTPDGVLRQSLAILEYLEEQYPDPALLPSDPLHRAQSRALAMDICCDSHPLNNLRVRQYLTQQLHISDADQQAWLTHWMHQGLLPIEQQLAETSGVFAVGDQPSFADIAIVPHVYNAKRFHVSLAPFPRVEEIWSRCNELEAFRQAAPEHQPDAEPLLLAAT